VATESGGGEAGILFPQPSMRESLYWGFCFSGRMRRDEETLLALTLSAAFGGKGCGTP